MLVAAWHLSPELSHKRRKGFRAWAEPCVASIDAAEPEPAAGGGVGGPWTVIAVRASTDHRSPSADAPVRAACGQPANASRSAGQEHPEAERAGCRSLLVIVGEQPTQAKGFHRGQVEAIGRAAIDRKSVV